MFRIALSLYLIVMAILGPGLCCCAFGQFFTQKCDATVSDESHASPCCHHHAKHHEVNPEPRSNQQNQPVPSCPCKQHQSIPVAPSVNSTTLALLDLSQELHGTFNLQTAVAVSISFSTSPLNSTTMLHLVQLCAQDGLRAPLVLRC